MLVVISGFACTYKCIFLIIFGFSSFFHQKQGKIYSALFYLGEKLICFILASKLVPTLVYHGFIRALSSLVLPYHTITKSVNKMQIY